jgi:hypothetical protein
MAELNKLGWKRSMRPTTPRLWRMRSGRLEEATQTGVGMRASASAMPGMAVSLAAKASVLRSRTRWISASGSRQPRSASRMAIWS